MEGRQSVFSWKQIYLNNTTFMKAATVRELKLELNNRPQKELVDLCLRLSRFKKENKELLTYLLYEVADEATFVSGVKSEIDFEFEQINRTNYYFIKKSVRKILRLIKKYIRYSKQKETEVELLIYYCSKLKEMKPPIEGNVTLQNLFNRQLGIINKAMKSLHEDLQYDFQIELDCMTVTNKKEGP